MVAHTLSRIRKHTSSPWVGPGFWSITLGYPRWATDLLCRMASEHASYPLLHATRVVYRVPIAHIQIHSPVPRGVLTGVFEEYGVYARDHMWSSAEDPLFGTFGLLTGVGGREEGVLYVAHAVPRWTASLVSLISDIGRSVLHLSTRTALSASAQFCNTPIGLGSRITPGLDERFFIRDGVLLPTRIELSRPTQWGYQPVLRRSIPA
jgi:hypothetical protein